MRNSTLVNGPHPVDLHVGMRVRLRRTLLGMSQEKLGEAIGLTFQQVQKYERGANRISASKLWEIAAVLDVPVSYFFHGLAGDEAQEAPIERPRRAMELVRALEGCDEAIQVKLFELAKACGKQA